MEIHKQNTNTGVKKQKCTKKRNQRMQRNARNRKTPTPRPARGLPWPCVLPLCFLRLSPCPSVFLLCFCTVSYFPPLIVFLYCFLSSPSYFVCCLFVLLFYVSLLCLFVLLFCVFVLFFLFPCLSNYRCRTIMIELLLILGH